MKLFPAHFKLIYRLLLNTRNQPPREWWGLPLNRYTGVLGKNIFTSVVVRNSDKNYESFFPEAHFKSSLFTGKFVLTLSVPGVCGTQSVTSKYRVCAQHTLGIWCFTSAKFASQKINTQIQNIYIYGTHPLTACQFLFSVARLYAFQYSTYFSQYKKMACESRNVNIV